MNKIKISKIKELNARLLYKFLKKNHCLQIFGYNYSAFRGKIQLTEDGYVSKKNILQSFTRYSTVCDGFCWKNTPQGHKYWENLNKELYVFRGKMYDDMKILKPSKLRY